MTDFNYHPSKWVDDIRRCICADPSLVVYQLSRWFFFPQQREELGNVRELQISTIWASMWRPCSWTTYVCRNLVVSPIKAEYEGSGTACRDRISLRCGSHHGGLEQDEGSGPFTYRCQSLIYVCSSHTLLRQCEEIDLRSGCTWEQADRIWRTYPSRAKLRMTSTCLGTS